MIVVTIGDIKGIGIEILINLWVQKKINNFVLVTNYKIFQDYLKKHQIQTRPIYGEINKTNI